MDKFHSLLLTFCLLKTLENSYSTYHGNIYGIKRLVSNKTTHPVHQHFWFKRHHVHLRERYPKTLVFAKASVHACSQKQRPVAYSQPLKKVQITKRNLWRQNKAWCAHLTMTTTKSKVTVTMTTTKSKVTVTMTTTKSKVTVTITTTKTKVTVTITTTKTKVTETITTPKTKVTVTITTTKSNKHAC
ncbi:hypothetical protein GCK72_022280 [Caenorhabditis remanei]|uniref:Uncharacterized protein n=1 Tax=Caenorhabditis remanei TaxID=31234 RepID=A0A6A5FTF9_CAERE|nr:hypothetical protein GCK72_022280 [Caenorhabditis remanei]KAF1745833.1 hypothetical protein GCK72_022280 [Caenorhabditis remanei]